MKPNAEQSQANKWSFFEFLVYPGEKKLNTSKRTRTWSHANYATNWCTKNHSWSKVWSSSRSPFFLKLNITHAGAGFSIGSGSQVKLTCYKQGRVVRRREASNSELKVNQSFYCFLPLLLVLLWRRAKRETELVSYGDLDARHSGDGVILLVGLSFRASPDAHATSGSRHRSSHVTLTVTLALLLVLRSFPRIFEEKRNCSQCSAKETEMMENSAHATTAKSPKLRITPFKGTPTDWVRSENYVRDARS